LLPPSVRVGLPKGNELVVNRDKRVLYKYSIEFLGHKVAASGILPMLQRLGALRQFPHPSTEQELLAFIGLLNFYRWFIPATTPIVQALTETLSGSPSGKAVVKWSPEMTTAFEMAKNSLADMLCSTIPPPAPCT
jgi:hypothetical protein